MKKIIYFIVCLFVITGCEATYTIDIDDEFNETLLVTPKNLIDLSEMKDEHYPYPALYDPEFSENENLYNESNNVETDIDLDDEDEEDNLDEIDEQDNEQDEINNVPRYNISMDNALIYNYKFGENYQDSFIAYSSANEFDVYNSTSSSMSSRIYVSDLSKVFDEYANLTKLTINVKTTKTVISHNADKVNGNIYTWVITKKNSYRDISITYTDDRYYVAIEDQNFQLDPVPDDKSNVNPNPDINPDKNSDNNKQSDNKKTSNKGLNEKQSKVVLYVLYSLFFGLIFVIIIFRKKFKK